MADRAAIVTGASSGIGLAIARVLGDEGYALTMAARQPEKLEAARDQLAQAGVDVQAVAGSLSDEDAVQRVVAAHRDTYGRLDVLVNNAGVGHGSFLADLKTKHLDLLLTVNLRQLILFYRESLGLLKEAGAEHRNALVVNTASISGKRGEPWMSVYSATKHGVVGWTQAMNRELSHLGIKSTALCPAFVDTAMADFIKGSVDPSTMIRVEDVAESVRFLLHTSPGCLVPEIMFEMPGTGLNLEGVAG